MAEIHPGLLIGLLLVLILASAFFSSSETGLLSLDRYRLRHRAKEGERWAKRADRLLKKTDRLLGTILIGNNFVNIFASSLATVLAIEIWGESGIAIATVGMTLVLLIFGEITPKTYAAQYPEHIARANSLPLKWLEQLFMPLLWIVNGLSNGLLRLFGIRLDLSQNHQLNSEELRSVVSDSSETLSANRQDMLLNILDLEKVTVDDLMVPRNDIRGIDLEDDLKDIIEQLRHAPFTRLPVFHHDINQVQGVVHMRQIARMLTENRLTKETISEISVEPYFVLEGTPLSTQLINFQREKRHFGMVVDEYGELIGIVTLEDILEEIVGNFSGVDDPRMPQIRPQSDGTYIIDASANLRELNKALNWSLPCDGPKTLNGLVTEQLEQIPKYSVCLRVGPYYLEILRTDENRVRTLRAWTSATTQPDGKEDE